MKILITNADLDLYAGTQVVVRDLALELKKQGHQPVVYSPRLGDVAAEIGAHGIEITNDLKRLSGAPDVIHGQHHPLVIEALLEFPRVPAVFVCHAARGFTEAPVCHPRIRRYVAVDHRCRRRLENFAGIPSERVGVILNAVDLERFSVRDPLPSIPKRVAVFSNNASGFTHLPAVRRACRKMRLELELLGRRRGNPITNPEAFLPRYDIVFAKARCALEAMAVGNAVVLCDVAGAGPMVSTKNFDVLRPMNFGAGVLAHPLDSKHIQEELERYDPQDAAAVCQRVRGEASLSETTRSWIRLYEETITEFARHPSDVHEEAAATSIYFKQWKSEKKTQWAKSQLRRIRSVPLVGAGLHHLGRRIARELTGNREL